MLRRYSRSYILLIQRSQFNLELQTGAFLGLILVLTATVSRLHMLVEELESATDLAVDALSRLSGILDVSG